MLAVQTDMKAPGDVNEVTLAISVDGKVSHVFTSEVAPNGDVYFPATVAITEPENADAIVRIRVLASRFGEVRVLREAITKVPKGGRVALLRMPLRFADFGTSGSGTVPTAVPAGATDGGVAIAAEGLTGDAWDPFVNVSNLCGSDKTSDNGECIDANIDSETLPPFVESEVFGGGDRSGANATCFDVAGCFADSVSLTPIDPVACTFAKPQGLAEINVAVAAPGVGEPIEGSDIGLVPLDPGKGGFTDDGNVITIPKVFCRTPDPTKPSPKLKVTGVFASAKCAPKTENATLCGPAFVGNQGGRDAGGGGRLVVDASTLPPRPDGGPDGPPPLVDGGGFDGGNGFVDVGASESAVTALTVVGNKLYFVRGSPPGNPTAFGGVFKIENTGNAFQSLPLAGEHTPGAGISLAFGLAHSNGRIGWSKNYNDADPSAAVFTQLGASPQRSESGVVSGYRGVAASTNNIYWLETQKVVRLETLNPPAFTVAPTPAYERPGATFTSFAISFADRLFIGRNDGKVESCLDASTSCPLSFNTDVSAETGNVLGIAPVDGALPLVAYYVQDGVKAGLHAARDTDAQTLEVPFTPIAVETGHPYPLVVAGGQIFFAVPDGGGSIHRVKIGEKTPAVLAAGQGTVYSIAADGAFVYWSYGNAQGSGGIRKAPIPPP